MFFLFVAKRKWYNLIMDVNQNYTGAKASILLFKSNLDIYLAILSILFITYFSMV